MRSEAVASRRYGTTTDYVTSTQICDSLGQARQTQTAAGGWNTTTPAAWPPPRSMTGQSTPTRATARLFQFSGILNLVFLIVRGARPARVFVPGHQPAYYARNSLNERLDPRN